MTGPEHFRWGPTFDWTPDRCAKLTELWTAGKSGQEIADIFGHGLTRSAIIGKVHRLRLPKRDAEGLRLMNRQKARREGHRRTVAQKYGQGQTAHIAPQAAKRLVPLPMPPPEPETACSVKFEALEAHHCRYVISSEGPAVFCGCNAIPGKAWCEAHFRRVYRPIDLIPVKRREIPQRQPDFYQLSREDA